MEETIVVQVPGHGSQLVHCRMKPGEGDDEVAKRLSFRFKSGTVLGIDGAKWRVDGPGNVTLMFDPIDGVYPKGNGSVEERQAAAKELPQPGETWKPKDPRRKASFKVLKVEDDHVHTDDGRTIQLARMVRYERV